MVDLAFVDRAEDAPHSFVVSGEGGSPGRYADGVFSRMEEWLADRGFTDPDCGEEGGDRD